MLGCSSESDEEAVTPKSNTLLDVCHHDAEPGSSDLVFMPDYDHLCKEQGGKPGKWVECHPAYNTPPDGCWSFQTQSSENFCCDPQVAWEACIEAYDDDRC
jgi:hypothetical protein